MIEFINLSKEKPYQVFKKKYDEAFYANQSNIQAVTISSFNKFTEEVDSRYVNLKYVDNNKFIFFSNYNSPKSIAFNSFDQISALFYWPSIDYQIRIKAKIQRTSYEYNNHHFKKRSHNKNALAISSRQSAIIDSYEEVIENYNKINNTESLLKCPEYWGGFEFFPYYFEFWKGHESRINKRIFFQKINKDWQNGTLEP